MKQCSKMLFPLWHALLKKLTQDHCCTANTLLKLEIQCNCLEIIRHWYNGYCCPFSAWNSFPPDYYPPDYYPPDYYPLIIFPLIIIRLAAQKQKKYIDIQAICRKQDVGGVQGISWYAFILRMWYNQQFSGCDTTSSFFGKGKKILFNF